MTSFLCEWVQYSTRIQCENFVGGRTNLVKLDYLTKNADQIYVNSDGHTLYEIKETRKQAIQFLREKGYVRISLTPIPFCNTLPSHLPTPSMQKITSFTINHLKTSPGCLCLSKRSGRGEYGHNLWFAHDTRPNFEPVMNTAEIHAMEHLGATFFAQSGNSDQRLYILDQWAAGLDFIFS